MPLTTVITTSWWSHIFGSLTKRISASHHFSLSKTTTQGPDLRISVIQVTLHPGLCEHFLGQLQG